jgi:DNA-binding phage protein
MTERDKPSSGDKSLDELLAAALARYEAMTPDERAKHDQAQRESWIRAMRPTGDPRFD